MWKKQKIVSNYYTSENSVNTAREQTVKEDYLLVDGYNIVYAWPELKELVEHNLEAARMKLVDILSNYQGMRKNKIIVVFDAYRVEGHREEIINYNNIHMVYTKEAQTADQYIEKFTFKNNEKFNITVATSDALEQLIVRGQGCRLLSARELLLEVERVNERVRHEFLFMVRQVINYRLIFLKVCYS